jgi:heme/copper-type cytochrome/quinol oxidase subunit 4
MGVAKEKARARADCGSMYKYLLSAFLNVQVTIIPFAIDTFKSKLMESLMFGHVPFQLAKRSKELI